MNEHAIYRLLECLNENLVEPNYFWPEDMFEEQSYARWAVYELIDLLMDRPFQDPRDVIEDFILRMYWLKSTTEVDEKIKLYEIAIETAKDVLTII